MTKCKVSTGGLPRTSNFLAKGEEPRDLTEEEEEMVFQNLEETIVSDDNNDKVGVEMFEDYDWINDDDEDDEEQKGYDELENTEIVYESEEDELEGLERKLTKENDEEEDSDENKDNEEEGDESVVDWDKLSDNDEDEEEEDRSRNGLFDNEAVESDAVETDEEVEGEDEEEDDGESLDDSDDERLFEHGSSRNRQIEQKKLNAKRRRIVVSDDEESD